jgi:ankyrin repeat protein
VDWTALQLAARCGHDALILTLLQHGANPNIQGFHGWTAMHYATRSGYQRAVQLLVDAGASTDACDNDSKSPADYVVEFGYPDILKDLCKVVQEK